MASITGSTNTGQNGPITLAFDLVWQQQHSPLFPPQLEFRPGDRQRRATQALSIVVEQAMSAESSAERARAEFAAMAHVQSHAAPWTAAIVRFVRQAPQGAIELAALTELHVVLLRLLRLQRVRSDGKMPVGLADAVKALASVQHPVWPLTGLRRQALEVEKRWK